MLLSGYFSKCDSRLIVFAILFPWVKRLVVLSNMLPKLGNKWPLSAQAIVISINVNSSYDRKYFPLFHDWENVAMNAQTCHKDTIFLTRYRVVRRDVI